MSYLNEPSANKLNAAGAAGALQAGRQSVVQIYGNLKLVEHYVMGCAGKDPETKQASFKAQMLADLGPKGLAGFESMVADMVKYVNEHPLPELAAELPVTNPLG